MLKHFNWPEQKADALREAAFGFCDLKKLESEASSFRDVARQPCAPALKKMQALLEKYITILTTMKKRVLCWLVCFFFFFSLMCWLTLLFDGTKTGLNMGSTTSPE